MSFTGYVETINQKKAAQKEVHVSKKFTLKPLPGFPTITAATYKAKLDPKDKDQWIWEFQIHNNPTNCSGVYLHKMSPIRIGGNPEELQKDLTDWCMWISSVARFFCFQFSVNPDQKSFTGLETNHGWNMVETLRREGNGHNKYYTLAITGKNKYAV